MCKDSNDPVTREPYLSTLVLIELFQSAGVAFHENVSATLIPALMMQVAVEQPMSSQDEGLLAGYTVMSRRYITINILAFSFFVSSMIRRACNRWKLESQQGAGMKMSLRSKLARKYFTLGSETMENEGRHGAAGWITVMMREIDALVDNVWITFFDIMFQVT